MRSKEEAQRQMSYEEHHQTLVDQAWGNHFTLQRRGEKCRFRMTLTELSRSTGVS